MEPKGVKRQLTSATGELDRLTQGSGIRCAISQTVVDNRELRPIAVFHSLTGD